MRNMYRLIPIAILIAVTAIGNAFAGEKYPIIIKNHLGSLYQNFDWSGPVRDPMRNAIEIQNGSSYVAMTEEDKDSLRATLADHETIMQIGGMGSAKLSSIPGTIKESFAEYMDNIISDGGVSWRNAVKNRAREVLDVSDENTSLYWQVGNEINAGSYLENIRLYFNDDSAEIIPVYVEYFLAPTAQAFQKVSEETNKNVLIALGSIAGFSNQNSVNFLDDLMNYEIKGDYARALRGKKVSEVVNLITIHYLMNAGTPDNPEIWKDNLTYVRDTWVNTGFVDGVWSTEEVGAGGASLGKGAGASIRVMSRYLEWISENSYTSKECKWFNYGTKLGPEGQQITDAMQKVWDLVNLDSIYLDSKKLNTTNTIESSVFSVPTVGSWLSTVTVLEDSVTISDNLQVQINLPQKIESQKEPKVRSSISKQPEEYTVFGWLYDDAGAREVSLGLIQTRNGLKVYANESIIIDSADALLIWVSPID